MGFLPRIGPERSRIQTEAEGCQGRCWAQSLSSDTWKGSGAGWLQDNVNILSATEPATEPYPFMLFAFHHDRKSSDWV